MDGIRREMQKLRKEKAIPIRESIMFLTGHWLQAIILQQMLYWSARIEDTNEIIAEEMGRNPNYEGELLHGWIYKSAEGMAEDILNVAHEQTVLKHLNELVEKGFLHRRNNPRYKWDKTYQYRVNFKAIIKALKNIGLPENIELDSLILLKNDQKGIEVFFKDLSD